MSVVNALMQVGILMVGLASKNMRTHDWFLFKVGVLKLLDWFIVSFERTNDQSLKDIVELANKQSFYKDLQYWVDECLESTMNVFS